MRVAYSAAISVDLLNGKWEHWGALGALEWANPEKPPTAEEMATVTAIFQTAASRFDG
jgi:hypothetical protein